MEDFMTYCGGILLILALIVGSFFLLFGMESCTTKERWNNGCCDECGGKWVYEQAVGHQYTTQYLYHCEDCGNTIAIYERR